MLDIQNEVTAAPVRTPNPTIIFETLNRYQHTMVLKGAIELDLFTHLAAGATTAAALSEQCGASERGTRILCDFLTILGFLTKTGHEYGLTPEAAVFLVRNSPAYIGSITAFLNSPANLERFRDVAALVRKARPLDAEKPTHENWVEFARAMAPLAKLPAESTAQIVNQPGQAMKVLDLAAGHGFFGISIAKRNPRAVVYALDAPEVLAVAVENARQSGVAGRFHAVPGSAFEADFGEGYDLVLITNFLHLFGKASAVQVLKKVRAALKPGGRVATVEFVPNEDRVSPPLAAAFSMTMLAGTEDGDAYTFSEWDAMFRDRGFGGTQLKPLPPTPMSLLLTEG